MKETFYFYKVFETKWKELGHKDRTALGCVSMKFAQNCTNEFIYHLYRNTYFIKKLSCYYNESMTNSFIIYNCVKEIINRW